MAQDHLQQRGNQFYLRLAIPRPIRHLFPSASGKPRDYIQEPLGRDITPAEIECAQRVAHYKALFARARLMTPEAVAADIATIKELAATRPVLADFMQKMTQKMTRVTGLLEKFTGTTARAVPAGETISQAAEVWIAELERTGARPQTLDGHRLRVKAFVDHAGDIPLASITRVMASDFLAAISNGRSNRTTNNYQQTMSAVFNNARNRGRASGDNPFEGQRRKVSAEKREAFTGEELRKIFSALPVEIKPAKHSPESALPWAVRIAAYSGMRLEEIAQLSVADIQTLGTNGGTVIAFNIHNGGNNHLKNESSERVIPLHSELVRAGLLKYVRALPRDGLLFPGLRRRESKGNKVGARVGELFRKLLIKLGMKRPGLCFHSLRHGVAHALEAAAVSQTDAARLLGHTIEGMSYGVYSSGPGLARLKAVVEEIDYTVDELFTESRPKRSM